LYGAQKLRQKIYFLGTGTNLQPFFKIK